jgi:subtilisin-like proprotein convertase family protein
MFFVKNEGASRVGNSRSAGKRSDGKPRSLCRAAGFEPLEPRLNLSADWLLGLGGSAQDVARAGVETDHNDNVYIAGDFAGSIQLDPLSSPAGVFTSKGNRDTFVAKYNSAGNLIWARSFGGSDSDFAWGLAVDDAGHVVVTGNFTNVVDFDQTAVEPAGADTLTSAGDADGFVLKLDSDGQFFWVRQMAGDGADSISAVDIARDGTIFVGAQSFSTQVAMEETSPMPGDGGAKHAVLASITAAGNVQWARSIRNGELVNHLHPVVDDRAADPAAWSIIAVGEFSGQLTLGSDDLVSQGDRDGFLVKLDAATGQQVLATTSFGGAARDRALSIANNDAGQIYVSGYFQQNADFNLSSAYSDNRDLRQSNGESDAYVLRLNEALDFQAVFSFGGPGFEVPLPSSSLSVSAAGDVYVTGSFENSIPFGGFSLDSSGEADAFVVVLDGALNVRWADRFGGAGNSGSGLLGAGENDGDGRTSASDDGSTGVALDSQGNLYVVGDFKQTSDFATGARLTSAGDADIALMKLELSQPRISGNIFADFNANGLRDERLYEGILEQDGWRVELVNTGGNVVASAAPLGNNGNYSFGAVAPGAYTVRQVLPDGWTETTPGSGYSVTVATGDAPLRLDFGSTAATQLATYPSSDINKPIRDLKTVASTLTVPDDVRIFDIDVALDISHTYNSDLTVFLISPDGASTELFSRIGGSSDNFTGAILDDDANQDIASDTAPYTDRFRPKGNLALLAGKSAQGVWTLRVSDTTQGNTGTLNSWALTILGGLPAPSPTKFYVVNDASENRTYEYQASGAANESYALASGNSAPRGAASTAAGDRVWIVDASRKVYHYDINGNLLGSWTAGTIASNATPEGIATNETDVWIVDSKSDKVYRYAGAASRLSGSQNAAGSFNLNSANTNPKDIVTNGASLWVVNDAATDKVFKYSIGGSLQGSWTTTGAGSQPTGITIDPANVSDIWIVDNGTDRVYQYTGAASRTSGSQAAATSFALAPGNTNPQGIADPPPASAAAESAVASSAVEFPASTTNGTSRTISPNRRTSHSASFVQPNDDLVLLGQTDHTSNAQVSGIDLFPIRFDDKNAAAVDAAFATIENTGWPKIVAELALEIC